MNKTLIALGSIFLIFSLGLMMMPSEKPLSTHSNLDADVIKKWIEFKVTYNKEYSDVDYEVYRMQVFMNTLNYIESNQGDTYTLGINALADITPEEFRATYLGLQVPEDFDDSSVEEDTTVAAPPASVNWVSAGVVPAVLNQGNCGSCWAFSAAGSISMAFNVKNKNNGLQLSPEQLVQCSSGYGNNGCNGGWMDNAFNYVKANAMCTLAEYPYTSGNGVTGTCNKTLTAQGQYKITGYTNVNKTSTALQTACAVTPVSIAVDASNWQYYTQGIFNNCGSTLDHGVILVGYTADYWYVRNSWGTGWGLGGYIQLAPGNTCGILNAASYPSV